MVKSLMEILRIYSPSGKEEKVATYLYNLMCNLGFEEVYIDSVGNVHGIFGKGPTLLMLGHMDTVPGFIPVTLKDNTIYGRGAVDAKGPLLAMIFGVAKALHSNNDIPFKVHIAALVDEEGDSKGAKHLINSNVKFANAIVCEPTNTIGVVIECRGSIHYRIECKGRGGHASSPQVGDSALEKLLTIILELKNITEKNPDLSITPTVLEAKSDAPNKLPENAHAIIDVRYSANINLKDLITTISNITTKCGCYIRPLSEPVPPLKVSISSPIARAVIRGILKIGKKPIVMRKMGTNDANILSALGKNLVIYGPGNSKLAHSSNESISINEFITGVNVYYYSILELAKIMNISSFY